MNHTIPGQLFYVTINFNSITKKYNINIILNELNPFRNND